MEDPVRPRRVPGKGAQTRGGRYGGEVSDDTKLRDPQFLGVLPGCVSRVDRL